MRYILAVLGILAVTILAIFLLVRHPSSTTSANTTTQQPANLLDHDNSNSAVVMTIQGRLVGEDKYQAVRITVTQSLRTVDILSGYEENTAKTESFPNTPAAYATFIRALNLSNFTKVRKGMPTDERGYCPIGNRFIYQLSESGHDVQRLWNDSCSNAEGTFAGSGSLIRELFQGQITDYNKFIVGTNIF